jgi:hypothetical protein
VNYAMMAPQVGEVFRISREGMPAVEVELIEAVLLPTRQRAAPLRPECFSLVFRAAPTVRLPQQIYRVAHDRLGVLEVFLVPIAPDKDGSRYEAVFN